MAAPIARALGTAALASAGVVTWRQRCTVHCVASAPAAAATPASAAVAASPAAVAARARALAGRSAMVAALDREFRDSLVELVRTTLRAVVLFATFVPLALAYGPCMRRPWLRGRYMAVLSGALRGAGPCTIKFAQWMSSRHDVVPPDLCDALGVLRSLAPAHGFRESLRQIAACARASVRAARERGDWAALRDLLALPGGAGADKDVATEADAVLAGTDEALLWRVFAEIDQEPLASGAIAQVHRARLRRPPSGWVDGTVAVKVRHPGVETAIMRDLRAMELLADLSERLFGLSWMRISQNVASFRNRMLVQCDLEQEAVHLTRFAMNFISVPSVVFPEPHPELVSPAVLVESFERGVPIEQMSPENTAPAVCSGFARITMDCYLKMALVDNFVHGDLHSGNILARNFRPLPGQAPFGVGPAMYEPPAGVSDAALSGRELSYGDTAAGSAAEGPDSVAEWILARLRRVRAWWRERVESARATDAAVGLGPPLSYREKARLTAPQVVVLDCGLVTELNDADRRTFLNAFEAVTQGNVDRSSTVLTQGESDAAVDMTCLRAEMADLVRRSRNASTGQYGMSKMLIELLDIGRRHKIVIASNFTTISVATSVMEGIARRLDPSLNMFQRASQLIASDPAARNRVIVQRLGDVFKNSHAPN